MGINKYAIIGLTVNSICLGAVENQPPTLHFKNKSGQNLALVVHTKNNEADKEKEIFVKQIGDIPWGVTKQDTTYKGKHIPSEPIHVQPWHELAYHDLYNVDSIDIYYSSYNKGYTVWMVRSFAFNPSNPSTTFYIKYCDYIQAGGLFGSCSTFLSPQQGKGNVTTEGYSLNNNIKKITETRVGRAGERRILKDGSTVEYPEINFESAKKNLQKLTHGKK